MPVRENPREWGEPEKIINQIRIKDADMRAFGLDDDPWFEKTPERRITEALQEAGLMHRPLQETLEKADEEAREANPRRAEQFMIMRRLRSLWLHHPQLRLSQLLSNVLIYVHYLEDEEFITQLEEHYQRL